MYDIICMISCANMNMNKVIVDSEFYFNSAFSRSSILRDSLAGSTRWPLYLRAVHAACLPSKPRWYASINLRERLAYLTLLVIHILEARGHFFCSFKIGLKKIQPSSWFFVYQYSSSKHLIWIRDL